MGAFQTSPRGRAAHRLLLALLVVGITVALTGCDLFGTKPVPNPIPEPIEGEEVGAEARGAAGKTPEATWEDYLRDSISFQVARQGDKITLGERYQNPDHLAQNLGGLVRDIQLVQDRTIFSISGQGTIASATTDFDVRVTFADGDSETRTCVYNVQLELDKEDEVWYVINPAALDIFTFCG